MTTKELKTLLHTLRKLESRATMIPWKHCSGGVFHSTDRIVNLMDSDFTAEQTIDNAEVIAESRNALRLLITICRASIGVVESSFVNDRVGPHSCAFSRLKEAITNAEYKND
jgi:hypothetical protein